MKIDNAKNILYILLKQIDFWYIRIENAKKISLNFALRINKNKTKNKRRTETNLFQKKKKGTFLSLIIVKPLLHSPLIYIRTYTYIYIHTHLIMFTPFVWLNYDVFRIRFLEFI